MSGVERSVRGAGRRYVEDATVGGVRRATRPGVVVKALWMAAIVTGAAMTAFSIHELVSARAARRELRSVTRMDDRRNQEFPAVTICNVNPFVSFNAPILTPPRENQELSAAGRKAVPTAASRFKRQATGNEMLDETFASRLANQARLDNLTLEELEAMGHPIHIFVPGCRLGDYTCDTRNFTHFYDDSLGNCYTFVSQPPKHHTWKTGPENGLTLYLSTNTQRRSLTDPEEIGVVVKVHAPHDTIFVAEEGVYVPLDSAAYVAITKACQRTCLQRSLVGLCGCCDVSLPCPAALLDVTSQSRVAAPRCNLTEESQAQCVQDVVSKYTEGDLSCLSDCKPRCRYDNFNDATNNHDFNNITDNNNFNNTADNNNFNINDGDINNTPLAIDRPFHTTIKAYGRTY
ncbi:hypothetical protein BaRGS_00005659 [Batillaria attramentaria]|uniref:Amiloride-sensitive sodium channel n=1 Tax=Batillaria attramentaria TaxID=370345 RepID=A0ABD0LUG2_9CAEN